MRIFLLDHNKSRRQGLCHVLSKIDVPEISGVIEGHAFNDFEQKQLDVNTDLCIVHMEMPNFACIMEKLLPKKCCLIVISTKDTLLTKVLEQNEYCILLKSLYTSEDVHKALLKVYFKKLQNNTRASAAPLYYNVNGIQKLLISSSKKILFLDVREIVYCKAARQYCEIFMSCGKKVVSSHTLAYFQDKLKNSGFMRIHRSYLINLEHVNEFHRGNDQVVLTNNNNIKLSNNMKEHFLEKMKDY